MDRARPYGCSPWMPADLMVLGSIMSKELVMPSNQWLDKMMPSHPLLSPSLPAFNLSQHQGLFK